METFLSSHATIFVVEQNRDAQLRSLLTLETAVEKSKLKSILSYSGFPMSCEPIVDGIRATLAEAPRLSAVTAQEHPLKGIGENIMSYINKPKVAHPSLPTNALGLTRRQYEGSMSTLCAGCGHDSVTAAIIEACWGLDMRPEQLVKLSGIGCSSKTTAYFVSGAHGFNSVHGRMPSIASGANAANRELTYVGISGDGDSLSIGLGQLVHVIRRNVNMLYLIENNGVYGLTKGQFSASADIGTKAKRGDINQIAADRSGAAGAVAGRDLRRAQLLRRQGAARAADSGRHAPQRLRADRRALALRHLQRSRGLDQELHLHARALSRGDRGRFRAAGARRSRSIIRSASRYRCSCTTAAAWCCASSDASYDPTDRSAAYTFIEGKLKHKEYVTGLIHIDESSTTEFHTLNKSSPAPLNRIPYEKLSPGSAALDKLMGRYR